jgi:hypothetical protein
VAHITRYCESQRTFTIAPDNASTIGGGGDVSVPSSSPPPPSAAASTTTATATSWPQSLVDWVERSLNECGPLRKAMTEGYLKTIIEKAVSVCYSTSSLTDPLPLRRCTLLLYHVYVV